MINQEFSKQTTGLNSSNILAGSILGNGLSWKTNSQK